MTPLQQAAQEIVDCWENEMTSFQCLFPKIEELRKALDAELAQAVEPYGWMVKGVPTVMRGSLAKEIQEQEAEHIGGDCYAYPVYLHPPQPQARAPKSDSLSDFNMRGVLASSLLCWKRLTEAEAQDLVFFFEKVRTAQGEKP